MRRLPLRSIEAFVAVARSLNLARAASGMDLTVPALSRRIQMLERDLGVPLFHRLPRGLSLTEAGAAYAAALTPAWDTVRSATEVARMRAHRRAVRVSVMPTFAANWLLPRLTQFHARHAGVEVELETSAELVDLRARPDLDCAIRLGKGPWMGLDCERLLPVDAVPVASPGFLDGKAPARLPRDLLSHTLIGSNHQPDFWKEWFAAVGIDAADGRYRSFDNLQLVHEAAVAGMGIAIGLDPVVRPYLDSGRLRRVFPTEVRLPRHVHLVRRQGESAAERPFALFRDWLFGAARAYAGGAPTA